MEPFLKNLASSLFEEYGSDIKDVCLVFPNRRAGLFFRKYLSEAAGKTIWSPVTMTINDLMVEFSDMVPADPVDLIFEVYNVYRKLVSDPESFDEFYSWGEMMIRDFNDVDKYMINPEALFSNITDLKEIDELFGYLTDEQKETIRKFWGHFLEKNSSSQKDSFLKIWKILYPCYIQLKEKLKENSSAYEGMIYRHVAENINDMNFPPVYWNKIIFAGFNALNEAEKILFRHFRNSGKGLFYWDYDKYYLENPSIEAGRFLRKNLKEFPSSELPGQFSTPVSQEICIYELPTDIAQAKFVHKLLSERKTDELAEFHDTAIILGNEDLLVPVLSSLPEAVKEINITMGYPLTLTPVYSFLDRILVMQKKLIRQSGRREGKFYYRDVLSIMNHQYIRMLHGDDFSGLVSEIHSKNRIYIDQAFFINKGLLKKIFVKTESIDDLIGYLISVLLEIAGAVTAAGESSEKLEKEFIYYFLTKLRKLRSTFHHYGTEIKIETFSRLLRKIVSTIKIPFSGEPLGGIQIMGILETRLLDFKNIIILSLNEGILPESHITSSYIPGNLRFAFGMPTTEDHDAISAYYFFRSLQRSEKVSLLFNSRTEGVSTGEKSRYLYQLLYDKRFNVISKNIGFNIAERKPFAISINKTPDVIKILEKFKAGSSLSPSSLSNYLDCRLRFYFSKVAGLREADEADEEIGAKYLGIILHDAMFRIYEPWIGKIIDSEALKNILHSEIIKRAIDSAFRKEYYKTTDDSFIVAPEGQNIITHEVINKFIRKIIQSDLSLAPFRILELEKTLETEMLINSNGIERNIKISGKIDRIDFKDGVTRIIDYKTGQADSKIKSIAELFDRDKVSRKKAVFQALVYAFLFEKNNTVPGSISLGIYITKNIYSEDFDAHVKLGDERLDFLKVKDEFIKNLGELVAEIFDESVSFDQPEKEDQCSYCSFSEICHRDGNKSFSS